MASATVESDKPCEEDRTRNVSNSFLTQATETNTSFASDFVCTYTHGGSVITNHISPGPPIIDYIRGPEVLQFDLVIWQVPMLRGKSLCRCPPYGTGQMITVNDKTGYGAILDKFDVLPSTLELLQRRQGGTLSFTSCLSTITEGSSGAWPVAFHAAYDPGESLKIQSAIYARYDLLSGRSLVLVLGRDLCNKPDDTKEPLHRRLNCFLHSRPDSHAFEVVGAIKNIHCDGLTVHHNCHEVHTVELESVTDTGLSNPAGEWFPPETLEVHANRGLYIVTASARYGALLSRRLAERCHAFVAHITQLQSLSKESGKLAALSFTDVCRVSDAAGPDASLVESYCAGFENLQSRLQAQVDICRTWMAERNARRVGEDSKRVRGIAVVTVIFLPATSAATFFSMVFFRVDYESALPLEVHRSLWVYFELTVPLTLTVSEVYALWWMEWSFTRYWRVIKLLLKALLGSPVLLIRFITTRCGQLARSRAASRNAKGTHLYEDSSDSHADESGRMNEREQHPHS